jgi:hypothetical protein
VTDRHKGCWVAFDRDIRDDDAEALLSAIAQLRGVQSVRTRLATPDDYMNRERVRLELEEKILAVLRPAKAERG